MFPAQCFWPCTRFHPENMETKQCALPEKADLHGHVLAGTSQQQPEDGPPQPPCCPLSGHELGTGVSACRTQPGISSSGAAVDNDNTHSLTLVSHAACSKFKVAGEKIVMSLDSTGPLGCLFFLLTTESWHQCCRAVARALLHRAPQGQRLGRKVRQNPVRPLFLLPSAPALQASFSWVKEDAYLRGASFIFTVPQLHLYSAQGVSQNQSACEFKLSFFFLQFSKYTDM